jgi:hypothetical protein
MRERQRMRERERDKERDAHTCDFAKDSEDDSTDKSSICSRAVTLGGTCGCCMEEAASEGEAWAAC